MTGIKEEKGKDITMNTHKKIYTCFPGGKHKVLTMSYDDGKLDDRRLVAMFNQYGIRGTFNLNSGLSDDPNRIPQSEWRELYQGHEIACHTKTHPTMARCPITLAVREIIEDREQLEQITEYPVRGIAYPNGSSSKEICDSLPSLGIKYARVVGGHPDELMEDYLTTPAFFGIPEDFYHWVPTCHHNHNLLKIGKTFAELTKRQYLYMLYVWGHSFEFGRDDNWEVMEEFCKIAGGRDDIWYATNIEIVDYLEDAKRLRFMADGSKVYNPNAQSIWISVEDAPAVEIPGGMTVTL